MIEEFVKGLERTPYGRLLRQHEGPLTDELVRRPADFGLGQIPTRLEPDAVTTGICGFCGTGCSLKLHLKEGEAINLSADRDYPVNLGMACPKGWEALTPLDAEDRATTPLLRQADGSFAAIDWPSALTTFCSRFKAIQAQHGSDSVAFLSTGQIPCEEMALLGAIAKFGMGIIHGDGNTRQCMATAVTAYKEAFGFDAPPYTYADFEESDVLIFVGANPCIAHPIMWQRVQMNQRNPRIIVIDPRRTETAMLATQHLPIQPKSDLTLFYAVARLLIHQGKIDHEFIDAHTVGFADFVQQVESYTVPVAAEATGLPFAAITQLADDIGSGKRVSFWWTMGVNQSHEGTRVAQAIINLCLMTGNIGRPGTGPNSITGQCNAMGSRLFSNTTSLLGGHKFSNAGDRAKIASALSIPVERIPDRDSWAYDQIVEGIDRGDIRGLWVIATNPAHSWINRGKLERLRQKLDFLVVQDMYHSTDTAKIADLVLPAAGWGEKEGTFINSERRIGAIRKVRRAPGQALADFYIFKALAHGWGCAELFKGWESPEASFQILKEVSRGQPCDISGIAGYAELTGEGGVQWPKSETGSVETERRLFADGQFFHSDGRARFCHEPSRPVPEPPDSEYPFTLLSGRGTSAQWHTQTRSAKSDVLRKLAPSAPYIEIHPEDAAELGIAPQSPVEVRSRRGLVTVTAVVVGTVQRGQLFMPMHFRETNLLTLDVVDPYSREPAYKACAVALMPANRASRTLP
ncbi:MAG: molybdopterin oxidoreductase family protein [Opitutales bacterium]